MLSTKLPQQHSVKIKQATLEQATWRYAVYGIPYTLIPEARSFLPDAQLYEYPSIQFSVCEKPPRYAIQIHDILCIRHFEHN